MSKTRRHFNPEFKAQVVLVILREEHTINGLAAKCQISPAVLGCWKVEFLENVAEVFKKDPSEAEKELVEKADLIADLERKVGQLIIEADFLKKSRELLGGNGRALGLKKKSRCELGNLGRGRLTSTTDRARIIELVYEAVDAGTRQFMVCAEIGMNTRTLTDP